MDCPGGTKALSGGYVIGGNLTDAIKVVVYGSSPEQNLSTGQPEGWFVNAYNPNASPQPITVYAECAAVS